MKSPRTQFFRHSLVPTLLALSVAVAGFLAYRDFLDLFFTAPDALTQIDTGRIQSFRDIVRLLSEPMMNDTKLLLIAEWYRPTAMLSYGIDYAIWGINPFGYHLTDLLLHLMVSVMTFALVRTLTRNSFVAWVAAILFVLHPVHAENVPAIARRHDALAMVFMFISLFLFLKNFRSSSPSRVVTVLSLTAYVVALGAKEIAPILPLLLVSYVGLENLPIERSRKALIEWLKKSLRPTISYFIVTFVYVAWRSYVLGGLGGEIAERAKNSGIPALYFRALLHPYGYPVSWIKPWMVLVFWLLLLFWVGWRFVWRGNVDEKVPPADPERVVRPLAFFVVFLLLPLTVLVATESFAIRRMYVAVLPMVAIFAILGCDAVRAAAQYATRGGGRVTAIAKAVTGVLLAVALAFFSACFICYSPLAKPFPQWREVATVSQLFLEELSEVVPNLRTDAVLHVHNLPEGSMRSTRERPFVRSPWPLADYSIKSWIDLNFPETNMNVVMHGRPNIQMMPESLTINVQGGDLAAVELWVEMKFPEKIKRAVDYYDLASTYRELGDLARATDYMEQYMEVTSDSSTALAMLGELKLDQGYDKAAEALLWRSLETTDQGSYRAYYNLVKLLSAQKRFDEADEVCKQWIEHMPKQSASAYRSLGWSYCRRGSYRTAVNYFLESLEQERSVHTYFGLTLAFVDGLADYKRAKRYARQWVQFDNRDANAYLMLGLAQFYSGEIDKAVVNLEKSLEYSQRRSGARYRAFDTLGIAKLKVDDVEGSVAVLEDAVIAFPDSSGLHKKLARSYALAGRCGKARQALRRATKLGMDPMERRGILVEIRACEARGMSR